AAPPRSSLAGYGKAYRLWPMEAPLDASLAVSIPLPPDAPRPDRLQVYRSSGGGWSPVETRVQGDRLAFDTSRLGIFRAFEDDQPPQLQEVLPSDGYRASTRRPYIRGRVSDLGS